MTPIEKIELIKKLLSELEADLKKDTTLKAFDDTGGSNPPGPGQPGKP